MFKRAPEPFFPEKLPLNNLKDFIFNPDMIDKMIEASNSMGTYKGFLYNTPNPMLLISPLLIQESVLSSKLEGTHATLEDFLNYEAGNETNIEVDEMMEIANYRKALYFALEKIGTINDTEPGKLPLSTKIIKNMHSILLNNVRGSTKNPGNFKRAQNYIGSEFKISYTPVPPTHTDEYMTNLENYIHFHEKKILIQSAIIHAQFEMIHPFEDGNGRIGRLLIPLFLYYKEYIPYPTFYMSEYFEKTRDLYINNLSKISENNDWKEWFNYYLDGVIDQASINTIKAQRLLSLYNDMKNLCTSHINSKHGITILDFIFKHPVFKSAQLKEELNVSSFSTVYNLLDKFIELELIKKSDEKRNITYYCPKIILSTD